MRMNRLLTVLLCLAMTMVSLTGFAFAEDTTREAFSRWNPDAPALNALVDYVEAVTDPDSPDFIPEADRIATFDMDGTLMGELAPTYLEVILLMPWTSPSLTITTTNSPIIRRRPSRV